MRPILLAALLVLAACGSTDPAPPAGDATEPGSTAPATTTAAWEATDEHSGAVMGAMDTMLVYCIPGLPGERMCDWGRISSGLTEVTTALRAAVAESPDPDGHAGLLAAADGMDQAITAFGPCAAWFNAGAATGDTGTCDPGWYALTDAWAKLKTAADWP